MTPNGSDLASGIANVSHYVGLTSCPGAGSVLEDDGIAIGSLQGHASRGCRHVFCLEVDTIYISILSNPIDHDMP